MQLSTRPLRTAAGRRADRSSGACEFVHSLVSSGVLSWQSAGLIPHKEELVLPPRLLENTNSRQIGAALCDNLETFVFGYKLPTALMMMATFARTFNLCVVGDYAACNAKLIRILFAYMKVLGGLYGIIATSVFIACFLHQLNRIMMLHLDHQKLTAAIYSLTRLHQHTATRKATMDTMKQLFTSKFRFHRGAPPRMAVTSSAWRGHLQDLLLGTWQSEPQDEIEKIIVEANAFFNGNILDPDNLDHWCCGRGCHKSQGHARSDAPLLHVRLLSQLTMKAVINKIKL